MQYHHKNLGASSSGHPPGPQSAPKNAPLPVAPPLPPPPFALPSVRVGPPAVQVLAYRALASGARYMILADHAGSGKTLAYLLPLLQSLKEEEKWLGGSATVPKCPRVVVVVPTAELCAQVLRVCRALSATLKFRSTAATGGSGRRKGGGVAQVGVGEGRGAGGEGAGGRRFMEGWEGQMQRECNMPEHTPS
jgi:hypothetical protein